MTVEETLEAQHQARMSLVQCAQYIRSRDMLIRHASAVGISQAEIGRILGLSRQHVSVIANRAETE